MQFFSIYFSFIFYELVSVLGHNIIFNGFLTLYPNIFIYLIVFSYPSISSNTKASTLAEVLSTERVSLNVLGNYVVWLILTFPVREIPIFEQFVITTNV